MAQSAEVDGRKPRLRLESDWLVLVEGKDEVNLFRALIQHRLAEIASDIQIVDVGGKEKFPANISAIQIAVQTRPTLRFIGVVRDADDNPDGAFQSVCAQLRNAEFEPPDRHASFSDSIPSVGVFIVPDGSQPGAIETLCRRSVEGSDTARCVEQYLCCLAAEEAMESSSCDKSFTHAYLAASRNPVARVGEGAQIGAWDLESHVFNELVDFLAAAHQAS